MKQRTTLAGLALAAITATLLSSGVARASGQWLISDGYSSWSRCNSWRIAYFHDGAQTGGCRTGSAGHGWYFTYHY